MYAAVPKMARICGGSFFFAYFALYANLLMGKGKARLIAPAARNRLAHNF